MFVVFFFEWYGDHRDLHRVDRRQRQMCIRDSCILGQKMLLLIINWGFSAARGKLYF